MKLKKGEEYIIVGSDNFWYASSLKSLSEVECELANMREEPSEYGNSEAIGDFQESSPIILYVYKSILIQENEIEEDKEDENNE